MMRGVRVVALGVGLSLLGAACSSDSKKTDTSAGAAAASSSPAPEDVRASATAVTAGLTKIDAITKQIATTAGTDKTKAKDLAGQIEPVWRTIEGTLKANDPDSYIAFEDAFAVLEKAVDEGDAAKAQEGATSVSTAVAAYLAKYPA